MEQFETRFSQVDVLPMVKHFMDELDLFNLFKRYVPATSDCLADHAESLCILTANIICDNKPLYKVQEWLSKYSDGLVGDPVVASLFNDDRLARALSALFHSDRHSLMTEVSGNAIAVHQLLTNVIHNDSTTVTFSGKYNTPDSEAVKLKDRSRLVVPREAIGVTDLFECGLAHMSTAPLWHRLDCLRGVGFTLLFLAGRRLHWCAVRS